MPHRGGGAEQGRTGGQGPFEPEDVELTPRSEERKLLKGSMSAGEPCGQLDFQCRNVIGSLEMKEQLEVLLAWAQGDPL